MAKYKEQNLEHNKNEDKMKQLVADLHRKLEKVHAGGGEKRATKLRAKGKMTARERTEYLFDKGSEILEIGELLVTACTRNMAAAPLAVLLP